MTSQTMAQNKPFYSRTGWQPHDSGWRRKNNADELHDFSKSVIV